ncbi:alpha/beta fold hydrolase [Nocardia sp. CA-107356]|uniref:alpha/beta fold hydrolase n=1 Tax=Nocardia sp. CA-107356 TaxID=3239972 RepID=UPI003D8EC06B
MANADLSAEVRAVTVPAVIIHGDTDVSCPVEYTGNRLAALLPHADHFVYENAPYGLHLTHRERFDSNLLAFIKK